MRSFVVGMAVATAVTTALAWGAAELALARLDRFTAPFYPPTPSPDDTELFEAFEPHGYPRPSVLSRSRMLEGASRAYWSYSRAGWDLNAAILARFLTLASRHRFRPAFVFLPNYQDLPQDQRRRAWLRGIAERTGTAYLDMTEELSTGTAEPYYIQGDSHLNAAGHEAVATALEPVLARLLE